MKNAGLLLLQKSREAYARKLHRILLFTSCLTVLILSSYQAKATQVTGTLTVDPSGTASATVFKDLNSVINYITSATARPDGGPANAAPFGVSGPLLININAGTYYEQVDIPAITGASASNTITLKGAGAVNTIVNCTTATTSLRHTIRLNSTSWVIVRDMTIRGTSASGFAWPVHCMGSTNNSRLAGCTVDFGITALSTQVSDNYTAVVLNNNVSTLSSAGTFNNIDIDSNYILGGHNSIYAVGTSASSIMMRVRKNISDSSNRYGMYFNGIGELKCLDNTVQNRISSTSVTDGTGIYVLTCNAQTGRNHEIRNNKVMNAESYGIHLQSNTLVSSPRSAVTNNAVGGSFRNNNATGIFLNTYPSSMISTWDVFFNSVNIGYATSGSTAAAICVQTCCSQEIDIRNNNLLISNAASSAVPLRTLTWGFGNSTLTLNSNNYYKRGQGPATVLIDNVGTVYTVSTFVNGGGFNSTSISKDPLYISLTNLYPGTPCNNGVLISGYTTDINGTVRAAAPDMGAYEYTASANDAGVTAIVAPSIPMAPGTQNVTVALTNLGSSALTSATVGYQLNGGPVVTQSWTGNLAACASTNVVFSGAQAITIVAGNSYSLKAFSSNPNASADGNTNNDSIFSTTFGSSLSGNYTIDPAGSGPSNFTSFGAATAALSNGGVNGPVVFNVASGTYLEQVTIPQVSGSSATNTITFNGGTGNAATRIISFAGTASAPHTLKLDNASYVNILNLTILGTSTTNGWPLHLMNTNFVTVRSCSISFTGTGLTSSSQNFIPLVANGSSSSPSFSGTVTNLTIENNTISGGYAGIYVYGLTSAAGSANHYLNGNNISNCSSYGIYDYYTYTDQEMKNNTISMRVGNTNGYGIYIVAAQSPAASFEYTGNIIKDAGQYGIYLSSLAGSAAFQAFIANNMIGGGFVSASSYGIYLNSCNYTNVWHNSVNLDAANMGTTLAALYLGSTNNADIRNNNLAVTGTNSLALPLITASSSFIALDYNNYYRFTNPVQLININGALYSSTNLFGAGGFNTNSRVTNPMYTNAKDLHTGLKCNNGISISSYAVDVDGNTRSNPPGIGADENTNSNTLDLAVESISSPSVPVASGSQNITVLIRNNGSSTITSANVSYKVNNGTAVTQAWTGSLAPCATAVVTFTGASQFNFLPSTAYTLLVYSDQPNAAADNATVNDTARLTVVATGISGNFTIDGSIPASATNFQTFATAITAMTNNGIAGPVNFTVAPATYAVQVVIPAIPGASSTNTVTFDGGANASTVILSFASSTSGARHTLRFDATNWIRIRNMSIIGSGTFAWPVHINTGSSNLQIRNCLISCTQTLTNQTSTNYAGIVISSSTSSLSGGNFSSNIDIDSNTITNGWYGISFYGSGNTGFNPGINIRKNKIDSSGLYGINLSYAMGSVLNDNTISMRMSNGASTGSYGTYVLNCYTTATENIQVNRNKITGCTQYGIYLQTSGGVSASTQRAQLINNAIGGGFTSASVSGIYFASANYWDVWFNSVNLDNAATGTAQCIYLTTGSATFNDIRNNNFAVTNASASGALCYRSVSSATVNTLNYNNYYKAGAIASTNIISVLGTNYTPSTFTGANGGGANSIAQNSSFTTSTNLLPTVSTNKGTTLTSVPTDIVGTYRNVPPDLGSYEIPSTALTDLAIMKLNSPDTTLPVGSYNVSVTVRNFGSSPITSFNLRHTVNGINMQDTAITGISLAQNAAMDINMGAGKQATFGPTANTLKVYLYQPNGSNDALQTNDSIVIGPRFPSMNGIYTINPAGSGPSNFVSFTTAATAINSGGVSGPVIFNVASGTFTEQITLNALNGTSATNTVRFVGNGTTNTILNFAGAAAPNQHTVRLNGSNWISFENMTISGGGTTSNWVVHLLNASNCTVKKCKISVPSSVTSSSFINILANNASTSGGETTTSTLINNNVIDSNTIENGYYGIMLSNNNGANINYMRGNTINNCYYNALYLYFYQAFKFNGNTINMRPGNPSSYGINSFVSTANSPLYNEIRNNVITNAGSYGIYFNSVNGSSGGTPYGEIVNNMIGGGFFNTTGSGINLNSCSYWKIWHNTVNYDAVGNSSALNLQNGSLNDVRNNIFAIRNASATLAIPVILSTSTAASVFNYNNLYNAATTNLLNIGGNVYTTGNYTGAFPNGAGINSKNLNPNFTSATNLHIGEACMNGDNLGIATDIDGNARGTTPDMGADEMTTVPALDASVVKINSPAFPFAAGTQPVNITIQNNGNTTLTGLTLGYSVNGSAPVTQSWSGSLASCDTLNFTFSATYNFSSGPNVVKVYVASPNGGADANTINDTITSVPLCTGLNGTYTINPAGAGATNFTSFSAALSALNCGGLAGAVVFNVANGVYNEQVNLGSVQGASATNTITIQSASGNASAVTISYVPGAENYVMNLNSTDYLTVKNITLINASTGGSYFNVVQIGNSANNNTFRGCVFTNALPTNGSLVYSNNTTDNNNTFVSNTFNGGSYGIQWQSNTSAVAAYSFNLVVDSNTFNNQYNYGVYVYYCNATRIRNNTVTSSSTTTYYGIYATYIYQNAQILNNNIVINTSASQAYGLGLIGLNNGGNASVRALIANNMIKVSTGTANNFGIYIDQYMYFSDVIHNTVNVLNSGTGVAYAISMNTSFAGYTTDNCNFVNNIFQALSSSTSSSAFYHNSSSALNNVTINYNDYFVTTGNIARFQNTTQATLANWKSSYATYNVNSLSKRASFTGANDLHNTTPCLDNVGSNAYLALVDKDIDGQSRNATTPDIGADEFTAQPYDIRVSRISAPAGYSASAQTVKAWIVNGGTTTVTSANIAYNINGGAAVSQNFTGLSLLACDSVEVTFTTQVSTPTGYSVLQAFVSGIINGSNPDGNNLNDTTGFAFCTSLAGNFTINSALSLSSTNFQSIGGAVNAMKSCGLTGAVNFTVAPGTYNEQVTIANIPGVSASNTITFDGVDSSNRVIQFNSAGNTNRHVIMIDSCRYVTIKNFKIINNSTSYGWGIHVRGTTATYNSDFVTIRKCAFVLPLTTSSNYAGVVLSNSLTSATTATNYAQNLTIDSSTFTGSYYGVSANGVSIAVRSFANAINNNVFYNTYYQGVYAQYMSDLKVNRNAMYNIGRGSSINTFATPVYLFYADSFEVMKNKLYGTPGGYGVYAQNCTGVSGSPNIIANNMIQIGEGTNNGQAVYLTSSPFTSVYYNSLYTTTTATSTSNCALYAQSSNNLVVLNNNVSSLYNTGNYVVYYPSTTVTQSDNNNYFGGTYYNGQGSVNALKNSLYAGNDANSKSISPGYISISDLHTPTNTLLDSAGLPIAAITDDIDGQIRGTIKSDIGADEFSAPTENTGVIAIINPSNPITAGANEVHVIIRNFGASVLTSDSVIYQVGSTTHRRLWTGSLATNAVDTVRFTSTSGAGSSDQRYTFPSGSSTIKAWTAYPNGIADVSNNDDTLTSVVCTGYAGTYTINPAGSGPSNFTSFTAAANALQCGITAPVTFNVAAGTYNEQFIINPIPGSSSTNTVLFRAANGIASSVVVQSNSTASNNYVVKLAGTDYVTFDKLTFTAANTTYGMVVDIVNYNVTDKPGYINITNCLINGSSQNTPSQLTLINALVETPNLVISGNTFTRGSYAVNIAGGTTFPYTPGIQVTNNIFGTSTIDAPFYYGVYATYTRHILITGNQFTGPNYTGYGAISLQNSSGKVKVNNNKINAAGGGNGITATFVNTNFETDSGEMINNSIAIGGTSTSVGIFLQYSANFNVYHNSVNNYSSSVSTYAFKTYSAGTNYRKNRLQNNLLISTTGYALYIEGNTTANAIAVLEMSNYNNLYTGGTALAFITTTGNLSNLTAFKNVLYAGSDANSVSGDPVFTSASNLVPTSCKPNAVGIPLTGITTDLNNATRKALPDMGAFEFTPALAPPTVTSPVNLCYGSTATALTASSANTRLWFAAASGGAGSTSGSIPNTGTRVTQTYYVADSSATSGCISNRAAITVNIDTAVTNNTVSSSQSICSGSTPAALTGSTPAGGNGTFTYTWVSSTASASTGFAAASGTNNTSGYAPAALTANTWYKRVVTSGACGKDSSLVIAITVTAPVSNNSISSTPQSICSGSTPATLTASTPTGGDGTNYTYSWLSSTTNATTGFAVASGTNNTSGYSPAALTASTWYRRVVSSGTCAKDTTAAFKITITNAVATNTVTSSPQTICSGSTPTAITGSTPTGGDGTTYTYSWLSSTTSATTGFAVASGTTNTSGYSPAALTASTWYRRVVTSGACAKDTTAAIKITITNTIAANTVTSSPQSICSGSTPTAITGSTPTGGDGTTYTYSWLSSTTSATTGFAVASGTNNTSGYAPAALTASTWYKRVVSSGACSADTTAALAITVNAGGTWTGASSNAWGNVANWSCPQVPTSSTNVTIPSGTPNNPVITDLQQANNITINTGATLTLNNANSLLRVSGNITVSGTLTNSNGKVIMEGSAAQTLRGTYNKLQINNSNGVSLSGAVALNDSLILTNGVLTLNSSNLTLNGTAYASAGNASSYVKTNGTGHLVVFNVGPFGKTGNVIIPVGNTTYNPVVLANTGTLADDYTVWVIDSVTNAYAGSTPSGAKLVSNAVNRTWFINEAVAGGSNASVTLQWNTADELGSFTRGSSYVSRYTGTVWNSTTASAASGSNPYTQVRTGITSFSPFGVGSNGVLPVEMLTFTGSREHNNVVLNWSTASEKNNKGFEVQRSADGKNWSKVDFVNGVGNSSSVNNYMFTDFNAFTPATKQLFYRLNQNDLNGAQALSNVVIVNNQVTAARFTPTVQPNPFNSHLTVSIASVADENAVITITDVTGKTISVQYLGCVKGDNSLSLSGMDTLRSGMYFVTIQLGNEVLTHKVVKQ